MLKNSAESKDSPVESTRSLLLGIWEHLSQRRRIQSGLLLIVILSSGIAEVISLGAVVPFLSALSDPYLLWSQPLFRSFANWIGILL